MYLRLFIFIVIELLLVIGSFNLNLEKITPWLLGINFTIAIFSVNFTFFGYQLSKYKTIYSEITKRQWFNITILLVLPFLPLICFLIVPEYFVRTALWILPILMLSAIDNTMLTSKYLSPNQFIENRLSTKAIKHYLDLLSLEVKKEVDEHKLYLKNRDKFQIPIHAYDFEPGVLGIESNDLWDAIAIVTKLSIENNDYPVFRQSLNTILKLLLASYSFHYQDQKIYEIDSGIKKIAKKRLHSIITHIIDLDKSGMFFQSLTSELCAFIMKEEILALPCSDMTRAVVSDTVWIGQTMLESKNVIEPIKILNTLHHVIEIGIHRLEKENSSDNVLDRYNISLYAYDIKSLGISALYNENFHFSYRCMESLSFLGCNAAKIKSQQTIVAVFESIVQIGRVAKHLNIGCFYSRCLIPAESHAEEFLGHILTWLVQDIDSKGNFYMKAYAEQAYSRLRGIKCKINHKSNLNPCFWIEELKINGENKSHIEYESGMWGYNGQLDYSDFSNLKEYVLHGIGSESTARIIYGSPMPIKLENERKEE